MEKSKIDKIKEWIEKNKKTSAILFELILFLAVGAGAIYLNGGESYMYFFGLIFFIAGVMIGLYIKVFGLIFLVSHGGIGGALMIASICADENILNKLSDISKTNQNLLYGIISVFAVAVLGTIVHNFSNKMKDNKIVVPVIVGLYLIGFILVLYFRYTNM